MLLSPETRRQIADAICRPKGSAVFEYSSPDAFSIDASSGVIIEIPAGGHYFRLDRTADRLLRFFHSSPGTGTRVASIDLRGLPAFERAFLAFVWSPDKMQMYCAPRDVGVGMLESIGQASPISFRIGQDGSIFQLGDEGVHVTGVRVQQGGKRVLAPTAIEVWKDTLKAIDLLWTGKSEGGFIFEVLQTTLSLSMLVTGFESYGKERLLEIEAEGGAPNAAALFMAFASKADRESTRFAEIQAVAEAAGQSVFTAVVNDARINFQSFKDFKRAFRASYRITIGEIVSSHVIEELRQFIGYRHRIVHVSPLLSYLNQEKFPAEEPVFANRALSDRAVAVFCEVVEALHRASTGNFPPP